MVSRSRITCVLGVGILTLSVCGCFTPAEWRRLWDRGDKGSQPEPSPQLVSTSKATRGTIGELVTVEGARLLQVRGFGLVVDLADSGGGDGPAVIKQYLIKEIRRTTMPGEADVPAVEMINGLDTAMVEVTALLGIPAGAKKQQRFDVVVRGLGTQTKSLAGGRLVLCELKPFAETIDAILGSKSIASASGPIFISPIGLGEDIPEKINLRAGLVLGGGVVKRQRNLRLVLNSPSPSVARRIENRINGRYAASEPVAIGKSHAVVELVIPPSYRRRKSLFLEHVLHTTLNVDPTALRRKARDLAEEITHPDAEFESIGVAWEAIGRIVLPEIKALYLHALPAANFCAGRAGMRLGDGAGMEAVARHALDRESPFRFEAIDALGFAVNMHGAGECLRKLLDDSDSIVRLRAYRALRRRPHPAIQSRILYKDNLVLDVVDSSGPYLVYVQRSEVPRIAIFGRQMRCRPPAMYPGERRDDRFLHTQISAQLDDENLALIFKNKHTGRNSPKLDVPLNVVKLIEFLGDTPVKADKGGVEALGIPYDEIIDILHTFCEVRTIPATFIAQDLTGADEVGTQRRRGRKESEF